MKISMLLVVLLILPFLLHATPEGEVQTYTLKDALKKKVVELLSVKYAGGKSLQLEVKNIHKSKDFKIHFETGLQFVSRDTGEQDQIIIEERFLLVKAGKTLNAKFVSYCTEATYRSPGEGSLFDLKENANGKLLQLAQFLAPIKDTEYTSQHAVWVITNDHDLRGLFHEDVKTAIKIQKFVADLTGKELPKYTVRYKDGSERQVAFTGEAVLIVGHHEYVLEQDAFVTCQIFNEAGEMVQEVFNSMQQKKGNVRFNFQLKALDLPKGKYVSKVLIGGKVLREEWVEA